MERVPVIPVEPVEDKDVTKMSDDVLLQEFVYWTRVYRNEELHGGERVYFKNLVAEIRKRKLLPTLMGE